MKYIESLEKAIVYIEDNLYNEITVLDIAEKVGYSYYHFNRIFQATIGESIGSYINKRRLSESAKKLIFTDKKIIDIALESGFKSHESYSRAFKLIYKNSPADYRRNRVELVIAKKAKLEYDRLSHIVRNITVEPQIKRFKGAKIVGVRGATTIENNKVPSIWEDFWKNIENENIEIKGKNCFGVTEVKDGTIYTMNEKKIFTQFVGIEADIKHKNNKALIEKIIPEGDYAVFTHKGSIKNILDTYNYIFSTWFINNNIKFDKKEDFELYDGRFKGYESKESEVDIYIPVII